VAKKRAKTYRIKLKNSKDKVILDEQGYQYLTTDPKMVKLDIINNLRQHSTGCAVYQKTQKKRGGKSEVVTLYLHKVLAEKFIKDQKTRVKKLVGAKDGNKLNCRIDNLVYRSRATASRLRKTHNRWGFTGVYKEGKRFRAVISDRGRSYHLGMFDTAEEAALAYNKKSKELFGDEGKQNYISRERMKEIKEMIKNRPPRVETRGRKRKYKI